MRGSFSTFEQVLAGIIDWTAPRQALDAAAGTGATARLLARHAAACRRIGIEPDAGNVERFGLATLFDELHRDEPSQWWRAHPAACFDLVVIGDGLGALPKSEGLDLLNAMVPRAAWIALALPEFAGGDAAPASSVWSERDLAWHDLWAWDNTRATTFALLRGHRPSPVTIDLLVQQVNGAHMPLLDFDGSTVVRPCRLRLVDHPRETAYRPR